MSEKFVMWEPEPTQRGTFGIGLTCLATLGISVWSTLHLSIPAERLDWKDDLKRKLLWMLISILLPEYLIGVALDQFLSAQNIRNKVNRQLGFPIASRAWYQRLFRWSPKHTEPGLVVESGPMPYHLSGTEFSFSSHKTEFDNREYRQAGVKNASGKLIPRKYRWTTAHGFYAVMGGFALGEQSPSGKTIHQVISPSGFLELLQQRPDLIPDILPDLSEEAIWDRGKSNGLATMLFIGQLGLFYVNCLSRVLKHLPVTVLEVSTVAHTLCLLVAYAFWYNKPLDAAEPMIIAGPDIAKLVPRSTGFTEMETEITEDINKKRKKRFWISFAFVEILYGVPYGMVWTPIFSTRAEQLLWQFCSTAAIVAPCCRITLAPLPPEQLDGREAGGSKRMASVAWRYCFTAMCLASRFCLLAVSWKNLFHLLPKSFAQPVWSSYLPYIT